LKLLRTACEDLDITLLPGMAEAGPEGRIFATHLAYIPGKKTGMYRKLHLSPPEQTIFSPGSDLPLFETCGFTFGIQLCYDAHFPFLSTRMAETGADALFIPHASPRGSSEEKMMSWLRHIPARAYDNGVYVLVCNQTGDNGNGLQFPGLSFFTDPSGLVVSQDTSGEEGLLICDLTRSALSHVRNHRMRYFLPHTRKDF
jgi:N-carbamoylputrescine amidase